MPSFEKLVRFKDDEGTIYYGEVKDDGFITEELLLGKQVPVYSSSDPWDPDFKLTGQVHIIKEVLCPLSKTPIFECIGVNYKKHAAEANLTVGSYPVSFSKPPDALAGPFDDIPVNSACTWMDYEAELSFIIASDCKNATVENAMDYVWGYTVGNDISSRYWQMPERSGHQHGAAKGFDKFGPIGPVIVSTKLIPNPHKLELNTLVNGNVRQHANTDDLIFNIPTIIEHLSRGKTLRKGTVVMTGTPSGVAAFMKPQAWLNDGDIVEVGIEGIGQIRNKIVIEKA